MSISKQLIVFLGLAFMASQAVMAYDPTITTDFGLNRTATGVNFTSTRFEPSKLPTANAGLQIVPNTVANFPGVTGLGISSSFFVVGSKAQVPPHTHPRATELFYVTSGTWNVGFIDTADVLYSAELVPGDQFVFPIGLIHYQNVTSSSAGTGFSAFNSQNPGVALIAASLFASKPPVPTSILADAFKISVKEVEAIENKLKGSPAGSPAA